MASSGALPQTLKFATDIKINEFSKQYALFANQKHEIIRAAENAPDLRSKAQILLEGITQLKGNPNDALDQEDMDLDHSADNRSAVANGSERAVYVNIRRFLMQSQCDPSVSDHALRGWIAELEQELQYLQTRHDHAAFYNKLVTECLANYEGEGPKETSQDVNSDGDDSFEPVGRAEMQEQRSTWESLVFQADSTDETALCEYLDRLFLASSLSKQALKEMREKIKAFGSELLTKEAALGVHDLKWLGSTLLGTDLLTKEKAAILKDFMQSDAVAREVIDVLNMRLATLASWSWPAEGIPVEMRRQLNGKYRVFMDEDILDALLLHYIGLKWSVMFKDAFDDFLISRAWKSSHHYISRRERARRQYFLEKPARAANCVNEHRFDTYRSDYFMTQLPKSVQDGAPDYDGDSTAEPQSADSAAKSALDTKHSLLHLLITESIIHNTLHGQFTALRSDFKWFGPSLSHTTILTVLEYFGVPRTWLDFFKTFLEAPIKFVQDGPNAAVRTRRRGVPMSHAISTCLGEAVLFCMDYAVNQHTNGAHLYRLHDDFWFWGPEATCIAAWDAMKTFTRVTGLEFNEEKTGSVRLASTPDETTRGDTYTPQELVAPDESKPHVNSPTLLPAGDIRWGFLKLDAQEGRFIIDQSQVDEHIAELQRQLGGCKSVFSWVKAWNSYFGRFFVNNFAKPAMCFGRSHIDMAIATLNRIERRLFPDSPGGVTGHLRAMIADRFGVHDLPDAFFYFPVELGGLELLNPYVSLFAMREDIKQTPHGRLRKAFVADSAAHQAAKERFEKHGPVEASASVDALGGLDDGTTFMSLEESTKHAEEFSPHLLAAYRDLTRVPTEASTSQTPTLCQHQSLLRDWLASSGASSGPIAAHWRGMKPYWRWIAELYQEGMVRKYGGLAAVSRELMPMGVVQTLKQGKFRWQG
ncbi:hypothetical protein ATEIFO6365_0003051700 [Aspergillus terreus]|uniref:Uncharacterized protein n=1 Tax=Aspergillus terreus TaxID=33178 RepID=A0A5M3YS57_ASPTE|nr:hypothetical protein ATETN484_0003046200 [Aspergillus terreus]GFF14451.1 hypothetical protein ATEIFO6365_0003051700 [Aspergillus terreus]